VVEDGRVTELGTHADLVAAGGPYATLWHRWRNEPRDHPRPRGLAQASPGGSGRPS
jgi:hypothetical protein